MKGKLHKMESGYILSLNGDIDDPYAIVNKELAEDYEWYKLSLKNCQAIELGYDLDELADEYYKRLELVPHKGNAYISGFQKALEILGDKKFSEEDMENAIEMCIKLMNDKGSEFREHKQTVIQSLQQTQWDVEIVMVPAMSNNGNVYYGDIPKLDAGGCLTLKRI